MYYYRCQCLGGSVMVTVNLVWLVHVCGTGFWKMVKVQRLYKSLSLFWRQIVLNIASQDL